MEGQVPEKKSDEIDVGEVFSRLGRSFSRGWMNFMRFLANMRRIPFENKILFAIVILATLAFGIYFTTSLRRNVYESTMILSCDYLNKTLAENTIDKLDALSRESDKSGLAKALGVSDTIARNIAGFSIEPVINEADIVEVEILKEQLRAVQNANNQKIIDEVLKRIEIENRHAYQITVVTFKPSVMTDLQAGIVHYFLAHPYIKGRIDQKKVALKEQMNLLANDIRKLDSLKWAFNVGFSGAARKEGANNVYVSDKAVEDPGKIYVQSLAIYDLLEETRSKLNLQKDFEIVDGFTEFNTPASPRLSMMIIYSLLIGWALAYLIVGLRNFDRYLANLK